MNEIYIIFECNPYRESSTNCIKGIYSDIFQAEKDFNKSSKLFLKDKTNDWILNLGVLEINEKVNLDTNMLNDIHLLKSAKNEF